MKHSGINVAFCENGAGYGGAIISLAAFLQKIPELFSPHIYTGIGTEEYQQLSQLGQWRHLPPAPLFDTATLKNRSIPFASMLDNFCNVAPYSWRFYRRFKRDKIGIVYLNNDPSCNLAAALAGRLAGLPIILHARGFSADTRGNRWVLSIIDHCIAVSNAIKTQLIELGLPAEKCIVVPEGLDMNLFCPRRPSERLLREFGFSDSDPVITLVGGLIDWKGQDVLLDACPTIFNEYPNARVLLVGSAYGKDDHFANMIAKRVTSPPLCGNVHLLGARKDIPEILSISSVVLHTSTKPEPFGRTFLEGMAMGKPVIASNEGGPPEVIEHEIDGLLIQPRDPHGLATAICRLLADPLLRESLGKNAAIKATRYSIENHSIAISQVLHRAVMQDA
ncbi:MAG TPA: glycosyltransferase [Noviherbaspirillum sp.]|nr:glycosyltransferase [Noviherbaspirillum sp.]